MTKRGETLELAVLGVLNDSPMHGYELRKQLSGLLGWTRLLSYGSLYPCLKQMLQAGWIAEDTAASPPPAGAARSSRRARIVYRLTAEGKERFAELVSSTGPEAYDDEGRFGVHLAFFRHTAADVRLRILEGRRRTVERQRDRLMDSLRRTQEKLDRYTLELQRHGLDSVDREVRWLTELIDSEKDDARAEAAGDETAPPST